MNSKTGDFTDVDHPIRRCSLLVVIVAQKATFQSTPSFITFCILKSSEKEHLKHRCFESWFKKKSTAAAKHT